MDQYRGPHPGPGVRRARREKSELVVIGKWHPRSQLRIRLLYRREGCRQTEPRAHGLDAKVVLFIYHDAQPVAEKHRCPAPDRVLRVKPCKLLAHQMTLVQQPAVFPLQLIYAHQLHVAHCRRLVYRLTHRGQNTQSLAIPRPPGERISRNVSCQPDSGRNHDIRVLTRRIEPAYPAIGKQRQIDRHSSTRIRSRNSAANSNCSFSTARRNRSRKSINPTVACSGASSGVT